MAKGKKASVEGTEGSNGVAARTRTQPDFQLLADKMDGSGTVILATVKGSTAAKAVGKLAQEQLTERYVNFRLSKQSYIAIA